MKRNFFWIGGAHSVLKALESNKRDIKQLIVTKEKFKEFKKFNPIIKDKTYISKLFQNNFFSHQGIAALVSELKTFSLKDFINSQNTDEDFVILDDLSDTTNIGNIFRSCAAFGFKNIIFEKRKINLNNENIIKSSVGSMETLKFFQVINLNRAILDLKKKNYYIISFSPESQCKLNDVKDLSLRALIFGSENRGIRKNILTKSNLQVNIPINNVESLNVASTVAITLHFLNTKN